MHCEISILRLGGGRDRRRARERKIGYEILFNKYGIHWRAVQLQEIQVHYDVCFSLYILNCKRNLTNNKKWKLLNASFTSTICVFYTDFFWEV